MRSHKPLISALSSAPPASFSQETDKLGKQASTVLLIQEPNAIVGGGGAGTAGSLSTFR